MRKENRRTPEAIHAANSHEIKEIDLPTACGQLNGRALVFFKLFCSDRNFQDWMGSELVLLAELGRIHARKEIFENLLSPSQLNLFDNDEEPLINSKWQDEITRINTRSAKIFNVLHLGTKNAEARTLRANRSEYAATDDEDALFFGDGPGTAPN